MKINVRKEAGLIDPETDDYMELDIFLPSFNLALECQVFPSFNLLQSDFNPLPKGQTSLRLSSIQRSPARTDSNER